MGRKDYNKGMEAGARPFEEKFRQEQKRNQEWKQTFEEKFDHIKETSPSFRGAHFSGFLSSPGFSRYFLTERIKRC